jgi:hypothetical protein
MYSHTKAQQKPGKGNRDVIKEVIKDLKAREEVGIKKYGEPLQTYNGRVALVDAYQEVLDLANYIKQELMEREDQSLQEYKKDTSDSSLEYIAKCVITECEYVNKHYAYTLSCGHSLLHWIYIIQLILDKAKTKLYLEGSAKAKPYILQAMAAGMSALDEHSVVEREKI